MLCADTGLRLVERAVLIPSFPGAVPNAHRERQREPFEQLCVLSSLSHQYIYKDKTIDLTAMAYLPFSLMTQRSS